LLLFVCCAAPPAAAGDWPQILGPTRDGKAAGERLAARWPDDGPRAVWQRPVGTGYAGVAVSGGRVVLFHRLEGEAVAEALDARSGKPLWKQNFPTNYQTSFAPDDGPRCVPLIHNGRVYLFSAEGDLHCLKLDSGEKVWSRDADRQFKAPLGYFGAGSTPIVEGDKLLVNIGAPGAGIVAFALADGKTVWQATDDAASYSSPTAATLGGKRHVIFVTRLNVVSLDPSTGALQFQFPFGMRGPTVNAADPLVLGDDLFVSANYGVGAQLVHIAGDKPKVVWSDDGLMSSQYTTCINHQGTLFGIHGRQDIGIAKLRAFDPLTRKIFWTESDFGTGNLILADDKLVIMKTDGNLVLAAASTQAFEKLASAKIFNDVVQPLPALAGGLLYVRDTHTLKCLDLGAASDSK
jgi:outer membrane protein assembly factor BamB